MKLLTQLTIPYNGSDLKIPVSPNSQSDLKSLGEVVSRGLQFLFPLSGIILFFIIIISGFQLLTSAGDPKQMEQAKQRLTWGVIGFVVIFVGFWLMRVLEFLLGIKVL
jgi:hypothetical protein